MSTFLTIYFWAILGLSVFTFVAGLVAEQEVTSQASSPLELVILGVIAVPMSYLASVALNALGFPGWLAWVDFALTMVVAAKRLSAKERLKNAPTGIGVIGLLLAWYGLQVLRGHV